MKKIGIALSWVLIIGVALVTPYATSAHEVYVLDRGQLANFWFRNYGKWLCLRSSQ